MEGTNIQNYIHEVLENMPSSWLSLTTYRLDVYNEELAKKEFLHQFEALFSANDSSSSSLSDLPTAYDYVRLGHPLSCILEWVIAKLNNQNPNNIISFSSSMMPVLAVLRKNLLDKKSTQIIYTEDLPQHFDVELLQTVYGYRFDLKQVDSISEVSRYNGSTIYVSQQNEISDFDLHPHIDFFINIKSPYGSILMVNSEKNEDYISEIQHVRRRETVAMTPANCLEAIKLVLGQPLLNRNMDVRANKTVVLASIKEITGAKTKALVGSSGLSIQYAIMMGLIHHAIENHQGKAIKFIVPPNCYGGTNDQARRVAACIDNVEIVDLLVDGDYDMVRSIDTVLERIAKEDAVPYIIAEIPTNPRVEVPDLAKLRDALSKARRTNEGEIAIDPVFILDQTFCPNVHFLGEGEILSTIRTIAYVSGSKFPSGGKCNAGYCVANENAEVLMDKIKKHLILCDNEATDLQIEILARQLPSMNQRIYDAYTNTREFVNFINSTLPEAKINFVSEELALNGFTPSVFSLDLPTKGDSDEEKESYKRALNLRLINLMITKIPHESKYCVSYGQLKGCYWTIPATSTQGTTKESDKDYIARVAISPDMDMELHKKVFLEFVKSI